MRKIAVAVCLVAVLFGACGNDDDPSIDATVAADGRSTSPRKDFAFASRADHRDRRLPRQAHGQERGHREPRGRAPQDRRRQDPRRREGSASARRRPRGPAAVHARRRNDGDRPGTTTAVTQALPAGQYAFICFIPSPDGTPHFAKGMLAAVTVTGNSTTSLPLPDGENATGNELRLRATRHSKRGRRRFGSRNTGQAGPRPRPGARGRRQDRRPTPSSGSKTPQGPPPLTFMGGPAAGPGGSNSFEAKLTKGTYVFYCPVPDAGRPATGLEHFAKGMFTGVTIT